VLRPLRSLLGVLIVTSIVTSAALCWFGWNLLTQQRVVDEQQARAQLDRAGDALTAAVRGQLADAGDRLSAWLGNPTASPPSIERAVVLAIDRRRIQVRPAGGLPFVPVVLSQPTPDELVDPELIELRHGRLQDAARRYRALTSHRDVRVRAGAWFRLGRVLRKTGNLQSAQDAYRRLTSLRDVAVDDLPADLAGLLGQRASLSSMDDQTGLRTVNAAIQRGLDDGRWLLPRRIAETYRAEFESTPRPPSWRLAAALDDAWRAANGRFSERGQRTFATADPPAIVIWRASGDRLISLAAFADDFFRPEPGIAWRLADADDRTLAGGPAGAGAVARVLNAEYPWKLEVWADASSRSVHSRRPILIMTTVVLAFVWGATYFMARAIRREAAVARLQSDFVAAVSHEFRSPLTTVRQLAELLESNRLPSEERRLRYYRVLAAEAARLQRLVETLLNFGRIEAGATRYRFDTVNATDLVRAVIREMESFAHDAGMRIDFAERDTPLFVRADEDALGVAVRNLVDNAIKYSPGQSSIGVECATVDHQILIRVIDSGPGIPASEQRTIFDKFVRGQAAVNGNVKGTGVGLSMVKQIVLAHGGEVRLASVVGRGSTFTIRLPTADAPAAVRRVSA
jgi:two-component system phosphate regulon sensor histidine kinase PhoR